MFQRPLSPLSRRQRAACALAAVLATGGVGVSLLGAFVMTAPEQWLAPSPEVMDLAAQCDAIPQRHLRNECRSELLASRLPGSNDPGQTLRVAKGPGASAR